MNDGAKPLPSSQDPLSDEMIENFGCMVDIAEVMAKSFNMTTGNAFRLLLKSSQMFAKQVKFNDVNLPDVPKRPQ